MAKRSLQAGSTSVITDIVIRDVNGSPITGLLYNSSGLTAYYNVPGSASTSITLATQTATAAWATGGFAEIDATHQPGKYRFDIPNAVLSTGPSVSICLMGFAGMAALYLEFDLWAINPQDAIRGGMTALPNANAASSGGLPTSGTGANQIDTDSSGRVNIGKWLGTLVTAATAGIPDVNTKNLGNTSQTGRDIGASVLLSSGTGTGQLDFTSGVVKSNLIQILGTVLTETAGQIAGAFKNFFNVATPTLTCLDINQTGDSYVRIGAAGAGLTALGDTRIANLDAAVSTRTKPSDTQAAVTLVATTTNLTNAPTVGDFTATMKSSLNAATPSVTVSDKTGFSLSSAGIQAIWDALTSALTTVGSIGKLLVTNLDAAISSRMATFSLPTNFSLLGISGAGKINGVVLADTLTTYTGNTPQTGDSFARLGTPTGASVSADIVGVNSSVAAVKSDTSTILTDIAGIPIPPTSDANAQALLKYDLSTITGEASRSPLNALRAIRNKTAVSSTLLTVKKEDDTTTAWTASITTDPTANPVVGVTPS